jgi:hypothetical protein
MGRLRRYAVAAGISVLTVAAAGYGAAPATAAVISQSRASAASGPTITAMFCDGGDWSGYCEVEWTGGTAPYTVSWTPEGDFFGTSVDTDAAAHWSVIEGSCVAGGELEAIAKVTDADGRSATAGSGAECDS